MSAKPRRPFSQTLMSIAGLTLIVAGIPIFITPIPLGAIMVISGAVMVLKASPRARWLRRAARRRFPEWSGRIERWREGVRRRSGV